MKTVKYIDGSNAWMVEPGDRLHFHAPESFRSDWEGERDFDITVQDTFLNSRHGPRIMSAEKIRAVAEDELDEWPEFMHYENDFYLADGWDITVLPAVAEEYEYGFTASADPNHMGGYVHDVGRTVESIKDHWGKLGQLEQGRIVRRRKAGEWEDDES